MRRLLTPRWLGLHLLAVVLAGGCLVLGWWQWQRGQAGNARSFAYALEWPAFAIFVLFMWGRMIYDELRPPAAATGVRPDRAATEPLAELSTESATELSTEAATERPTELPTAESSSDAGARALDEDDPELAAYNRYLAELNARAQRYRR